LQETKFLRLSTCGSKTANMLWLKNKAGKSGIGNLKHEYAKLKEITDFPNS